MLRSILNSSRGRSAAGLRSNNVVVIEGTRGAGIPLVDGPFIERLPEVTASRETVRPERCCVYCGHGIYVGPRVPRVRCPKCFQDIAVQDILLVGVVETGQVVTAGKITVDADARVAADLVACSVEIAGRVLGNILASQRCVILPTGKQAGRILCRHLDLRPGAEVVGEIELIQG
jgi:Polymer-forming cytoskeletal